MRGLSSWSIGLHRRFPDRRAGADHPQKRRTPRGQIPHRKKPTARHLSLTATNRRGPLQIAGRPR